MVIVNNGGRKARNLGDKTFQRRDAMMDTTGLENLRYNK